MTSAIDFTVSPQNRTGKQPWGGSEHPHRSEKPLGRTPREMRMSRRGGGGAPATGPPRGSGLGFLLLSSAVLTKTELVVLITLGKKRSDFSFILSSL